MPIECRVAKLTCAFLWDRYQAGQLRVRLGEWDVNRETEFYQHMERDVVSYAVHPEYYAGNLFNDIVVLKFEGSVDSNFK